MPVVTDSKSMTPTRIALDTSCVVNLLSRKQDPNQDLLRLVRLGTEGRARLMVTPIVDLEVPRAADGLDPADADDRAFIRKRLAMFAEDQISPGRKHERDGLGAQFHTLLWPNAKAGSRTSEHGLRDCLHLASLKLCGGGVFVTLDEKFQRKARQHQSDLHGCEVLLPSELVARLPKPRAASSAPDAVVRRARPDDAGAVTDLMTPIRSSYPKFDVWRAKALSEKNAYVGVFEGQVAGIAVWSEKDDRVVKLSTFYVGDDHQGQGLGPHLIFHQMRLWVEHGYEKVFVTVSSERLHVLDFFLSYGFRIEGASARRYKAGETEFILTKHFFYEDVDDGGFDAFLARLSREVFGLPQHARVQDPSSWFVPPRQRELRAHRDEAGVVSKVGAFDGGTEVATLNLNELDEIVYPARLSLRGREAFLIPIRPKWADAMMEIPREQGELFPNTDKLRLRTDNAYYCSPRLGPQRLTGSPVLFYVSGGDKGVAGFARIVSCLIAPPEELHFEFGEIGIYELSEVKAHARPAGSGKYSGKAMALKFAWWVPFVHQVGLQRLRTEFDLSHPQTVTSVPYSTFVSILRAGGVTW